MSEEILLEIKSTVQKGQMDTTVSLVQQALSDNMPAESILNDGLIAGLHPYDFTARVHAVSISSRGSKVAPNISKK